MTYLNSNPHYNEQNIINQCLNGGVRITSISCKSTNESRPRKDFPCKNCGSNANGACSACGIYCKKCICTNFIDGEAINKEEEERKLLARRKEQRELKKRKGRSNKKKLV